MKKEMLRIHNLNCISSTLVKLVDTSLYLMAGETIGLLGLINSGKNLLIDILCGCQEEFQGTIFLEGKRVVHMTGLHKYVYKINISNYLIDNWSVAEYIYLLSEPSIMGIYHRKKLIRKANSLIQELGLNLDASKELKNLTELEKRLMDLVKAYNQGAKVLVIEDDLEGCSPQDIMQFKTVLNHVINDRMVAIVNSYSDQVLKILSDKYIFFKKGRIVKKCNKDYIKDKNHMEKLLLGNTVITRKRSLDNYEIEYNTTKDTMYSVRNMLLKNNEIQFDFYKGEVVSILDLDVKEKKYVFDLLSGRCIDKSLDLFLEQSPCYFSDITDFVKHKIVSIANLGNKEELLLQMSIGDNLLLPSLDKVTSMQYVFSQHKITDMLEKEVKENITEFKNPIQDMSTNDCFVLLLERWYIFKPKVLILFEPFIHCDLFSLSLVKSYIRKFTKLGTTVIMIKSSPEYIEDISNRIIYIE